jgi:hypothetical protein
VIALAQRVVDGFAFDGPAIHEHDALDVSSGVLNNLRFSAYSDLLDEGCLNGDSSTDLLPRIQLDSRYLNSTGNELLDGSLTIMQGLTVGGDLYLLGGNIGLGVLPNNNYGIVNDMAAPPVNGARLVAPPGAGCGWVS